MSTYLDPLLSHALQHIPPSQQADTPIYILATAGMRLLPTSESDAIIAAACSTLRQHYPFRLEEKSSIGPCGESIRIISGEEEGMWGWVAVNYLMDGFGHAPYPATASTLLPLAPLAEPPPDSDPDSVTPVDPSHHSPTFGFLDMGGASTQLAFSPTESELIRSDFPSSELRSVSLRLLSGEVVEWPVFVASWLGFGTNRVKERYTENLVSAWRDASAVVDLSTPIPDPCLPIDLLIPSPEPDRYPSFVGTGSFSTCLTSLRPLLDSDLPCATRHCLFGGLPTPHIDFERDDQRGFIGISEYWYTAQEVLGLGGVWDWAEWEKGMGDFCARPWHAIESQVMSEQERPGAEIERLQAQCFKGAWISNVLHEGIGIPRLVDAGGTETLTGGAIGETNSEAERRAQEKGLLEKPGRSKSHFQSMDEVGSTAISWTLGKMVIEASKGVSPPTLSWVDRITAAGASHLQSLESGLNMYGVNQIWLYLFVSACVLTCGVLSFRRRVRSPRRGRKPSISGDAPLTADTYSLDEVSVSKTRQLVSKMANTLRRNLPFGPHRPRMPRQNSLPLVNTLSIPYTAVSQPPSPSEQYFTPASIEASPPRPKSSTRPSRARQNSSQAHLGVSTGWNDPPSSILNGGLADSNGTLTPVVTEHRTISRQSSRVNLNEAAGLAQRSASRAGTPYNTGSPELGYTTESRATL